MIKNITTLFCLLLSFNAFTQTPQRVVVVVENEDVFYALEQEKEWFCEFIYQNIREGKLIAFQDSMLQKKYSVKELELLTLTESVIQIPDPNSPDDPYALLDTVVRTPFMCQFQPMEVYARYLKFHHSASFSFFLDRTQLKLLSGRTKLVDFAANYMEGQLNETAFKIFAKHYSVVFSKRLYQLFQTNALKGYHNDSLTSFFTPKEVIKLGGFREVKKINGKDSVAPKPMHIDSLKGIGIYFSASADQQEIHLRAISFAPLYHPMIGDFMVSLQPIFHAKKEDVKKSMSAEESYLWDILLTYYTQRAFEMFRWNRNSFR